MPHPRLPRPPSIIMPTSSVHQMRDRDVLCRAAPSSDRTPRAEAEWVKNQLNAPVAKVSRHPLPRLPPPHDSHSDKRYHPCYHRGNNPNATAIQGLPHQRCHDALPIGTRPPASRGLRLDPPAVFAGTGGSSRRTSSGPSPAPCGECLHHLPQQRAGPRKRTPPAPAPRCRGTPLTVVPAPGNAWGRWRKRSAQCGRCRRRSRRTRIGGY